MIRLAQAALDYCRFVLDVAARARQAGLSALQAAQETGRQRTRDLAPPSLAAAQDNTVTRQRADCRPDDLIPARDRHRLARQVLTTVRPIRLRTN